MIGSSNNLSSKAVKKIGPVGPPLGAAGLFGG